MEETIVNRVTQSGLITFDLEEYYPKGERALYDLKQNLFMELILKEKDFREFLKTHDWEQYRGKYVGIVCTADAIVPTWAYMLLAGHMSEVAEMVVFGNLEQLEIKIFEEIFRKINWEEFQDQRIVVKGCSNASIPVEVYVELTRILKPIARSLMFGEPCSTVPLFKKKSN